MNRRDFFLRASLAVAGVALTRTWPFRAYSFAPPKDIMLYRVYGGAVGGGKTHALYEFMGLPMIVDPLAPPDTLYLVDSKFIPSTYGPVGLRDIPSTGAIIVDRKRLDDLLEQANIRRMS